MKAHSLTDKKMDNTLSISQIMEPGTKDHTPMVTVKDTELSSIMKDQ